VFLLTAMPGTTGNQPSVSTLQRPGWPCQPRAQARHRERVPAAAPSAAWWTSPRSPQAPVTGRTSSPMSSRPRQRRQPAPGRPRLSGDGGRHPATVAPAAGRSVPARSAGTW